MPKTNIGRNIADEKIIALIWGAKSVCNLTDEQLCAKVSRGTFRLSRQTLANRKKSPEDFTLGELRRLGRALDIPIEELRAAIRY